MKPWLMLSPLLIALLSTSAHAHGIWLLPSSTVLSAPQFVTFDAAVSNDIFHFNHRPLPVDQLKIVAPDRSLVTPENVAKGELRTTFDANLKQTGTYKLQIVRSGLRARWKEGSEAKRFMGDAEKLRQQLPAHATDVEVNESASRIETYVTVGTPSEPPLDQKGLEMRSETHPNDLVAGEQITLQFLVDGKPAAGVQIEVVRGESRYRNDPEPLKLTSGADGRVRLALERAGMYWLDADITDNKVSDKLAKERGLAYTVTLEVLPK